MEHVLNEVGSFENKAQIQSLSGNYFYRIKKFGNSQFFRRKTCQIHIQRHPLSLYRSKSRRSISLISVVLNNGFLDYWIYSRKSSYNSKKSIIYQIKEKKIMKKNNEKNRWKIEEITWYLNKISWDRPLKTPISW